MSEYQEEPGHGNSVAAWVAVIVAIIGISALTLGYLLAMTTMLIIGAVLSVVSIFLGPLLAKLGYGLAGKANK